MWHKWSPYFLGWNSSFCFWLFHNFIFLIMVFCYAFWAVNQGIFRVISVTYLFFSFMNNEYSKSAKRSKLLFIKIVSRLLVANIRKTDIIVSVTNDPLEKKKSWGLFCLKPQSFLDLFLIICLKVSRNFLLKGFNLILDVFNWLLFLARGNTHGYSFWCLFWILAGWCWNVLCCGIYE